MYYQPSVGPYMTNAATVAPRHTSNGPIRHAQEASQTAYFNAIKTFHSPLIEIDKRIGTAIGASRFSVNFIVGTIPDMNAREHKDIMSLIRVLTARGYEVRFINKTVQRDGDNVIYTADTELIVEFPPAKGSMV